MKLIISSVFRSKGSQLLYVYDFLNMWRFLITFHESAEKIQQMKQFVLLK